jgi:hypothetical protein
MIFTYYLTFSYITSWLLLAYLLFSILFKPHLFKSFIDMVCIYIFSKKYKEMTGWCDTQERNFILGLGFALLVFLPFVLYIILGGISLVKKMNKILDSN